MISGSRSPGTGIPSLVITTLVVAAVWLFVLPRIAERPVMKAHLEWLDERGIDPSAMFYTELDAMDEMLRRQRTTERSRATRERLLSIRRCFSCERF